MRLAFTRWPSRGHFLRVSAKGYAAFSCAILLGLALLPSLAVGADKGSDKKKNKEQEDPATIFLTTHVWNAHLSVSADAWEKLEPKGGGGMFGGARGRGPGRPGGDFGPGTLLAPAFLKDGDLDGDSVLTKKELETLAGKWFAAWDKEQSGALSSEKLGDGLNTVMTFPRFGRGGRGGGGGMNLQGAEGKRNGLASAAGVEFETVRGDLEFGPHLLKDVALRYKGNGTWMQSRHSDKKSLKVDLNDNVKGQKVAGMTKLNFHNSVTDPSWMNEVLAYRLYRDAGVPASRTAYARMEVTVPGKHNREYIGLYSVVENVDSHFAKDVLGTKKGALFKPVSSSLFTDLGDDWKSYQQTYDPKTDLTPEQKQRVIDFCKFVSKSNDQDFAAKLGDYVDLEEFSRYMAVTVLLSELDGILGPGQNFYLHLDPKTDRFQFLPWDLDHSFGQFGMRGSQEEREQLSIHKPWQGKNAFLERVYKVAAFKQPYLARLKESSETLFTPARLAAQVDEVAAAIRSAVKEESSEMLQGFETAVAGTLSRGRPAGDRPPGGGEGRGPGGFGQAMKPIKAFVPLRVKSVMDQLAGKSEGLVLGEFGFGSRAARGPGGGFGGAGGVGGLPAGPGRFLSVGFVSALDADKNQTVSKDEFVQGFGRWFDRWDTAKGGILKETQIAAGLNQEVGPPRGGPQGPQ